MSQLNNDNYSELPWKDLDVEQIVSIDFGSFGFAASFCPPGAPSHQRIIQDWSDHRACTELNKNLTALLIAKETTETVAIGYEAEELYMKAHEKKEDDKYMYFEHFKPSCYSNDRLETNIAILAADGQSTLPLSDLIIKCLVAIMKHSLLYINQLNKLAGIEDITKNKVFWVISVPAIWDETSKQMMRHCAHNAGMKHFELGSEPIVSTFYVLNLQGKYFKLKTDDKIMTLDCGGRHINSACIEIKSSSFDIAELYHSDGIRAGGLDVDTQFMKLLNELLPNDIIDPVKTRQPAQWIRQKQEFMLAKFSCPFELEDTWRVSFCFGINCLLAKKRKKRKKDATYKNIKSHIDKYEITDYLNTIDENKENKKTISGSFILGRARLRINKTGWIYLHEAVFHKLVNFMNHLFDNNKIFHYKLVVGYIRRCFDDYFKRFPMDIVDLIGCFYDGVGLETVMLVGGFANSQYLVNRLLQQFPDKNFFTPRQPHLAVVKGALYWIHQRKKLKKTRARYSYAIIINRKFDTISLLHSFGTLITRNKEYEDGYKECFDYLIPKDVDYLEIRLLASEDSFFPDLFKKDGREYFEAKKFVIAIKHTDKEHVQRKKIQLTLEYRHDAINLFYIDPNDGKEKCV